jgi:hypothetical protein
VYPHLGAGNGVRDNANYLAKNLEKYPSTPHVFFILYRTLTCKNGKPDYDHGCVIVVRISTYARETGLLPALSTVAAAASSGRGGGGGGGGGVGGGGGGGHPPPLPSQLRQQNPLLLQPGLHTRVRTFVVVAAATRSAVI